MNKNYFAFLLFTIFFVLSASSQTYNLDDGMVGRIPIIFKKGSFLKIQDSTLLLKLNPVAFEESVSEYKIVQDQNSRLDLAAKIKPSSI